MPNEANYSTEHKNMTGIGAFMNALQGNPVRTQNLFEVEIFAGISSVDNYFKTAERNNKVTMYAEGFTLPSRSQDFVDISFKGYPIPIPTLMKMEQDHSMTIRADYLGNFRRGFLAWMAATCDPGIGNDTVFKGDRRFHIESTITVHLLDYTMDASVEDYILHGVRIQSVGGLTMSNNDSGVATFEVQFKSLWWDIKDVKDGSFESAYDSAKSGAIEGAPAGGDETVKFDGKDSGISKTIINQSASTSNLNDGGTGANANNA